MFGIFIHTIDASITYDLLNGPQIFDFTTLNLQLRNGNLGNLNPFSLEMCTKEHWKIIPSLVEKFDNLQMNKWLCPKLNS